MAVRSGMVAIVAQLRQYGQAAPDDVFDGITYWSDEQLQQIADRNGQRRLVKLQRANPAYTIYRIVAPRAYEFENTLAVYDDSDIAVSTLFTFNSDTKELTFASALADETYQAFGLVIDMNEALADLWQNKANQRFNYIDWKAQNNKMNMAQEYQHCVSQSLYYRNKRIRTFDRKGRGKWAR